MTGARAAIAGAAACAALAAAPLPASATTTVTYSSSSGLSISGEGSSEGLQVGFREPGVFGFSGIGIGGTTFDTDTANFAAGPGCQPNPPGHPICQITGSLVVTAVLGDGQDLIQVGNVPGFGDMFVDAGPGTDQARGGPGFDSIEGGPGDDHTLMGGAGDDVVDGGEGNDRILLDGGRFFSNPTDGSDVIRGGPGNDLLVASAENPHPDAINGGPGRDVADYSARTTRVDLRAVVGGPVPAGAETGPEGDTVTGVERLIGGTNGDFLRADPATPTTLGSIDMRGGAGNDSLIVDKGVAGDLEGGAGTDTYVGGDRGDAINSRDGERDLIVNCRGGADLLFADLRDNPIPTTCESVNQSALREGPNVVVASRSVDLGADGSLSVRLRCPRKLSAPCAGKLAARVDRTGTRFGAGTSYSLGPGKSAVVRARIPAAQRRGARVRVRSVERGLHGPKTTLRSLPVSG